MTLTKEDVKKAFREVMAKSYADIPPKEDIEYTPSPRAKAMMAEFLAKQAAGLRSQDDVNETNGNM